MRAAADVGQGQPRGERGSGPRTGLVHPTSRESLVFAKQTGEDICCGTRMPPVCVCART